MPRRATHGLLLAGGESRRMGRDKALLDRGGESQLEYLARILGECVDELFVSTRKDQHGDESRQRFRQIVDRYDNIGPLAGILTALESYPDADWLVVACDLPNVDLMTFEHLLAHGDSQKPFSAYTSTYDGLPEPLCALYRSGSEKILREFVEQGVHCPRKILIRSDTDLHEQINARSLDNVNSPADLKDSVLRAIS